MFVTLPVEVILAEDAHQCQKFVDFAEIEYRAIVELNQTRALIIKSRCLQIFSESVNVIKEFVRPTVRSRISRLSDSPVDARHVDNNVDHVAAKLVTLHVNRRAVGCNVNL